MATDMVSVITRKIAVVSVMIAMSKWKSRAHSKLMKSNILMHTC